jgi:hypothetical protein
MRRVLSTLTFTLLVGSPAIAGPVEIFPEPFYSPFFPITWPLWKSTLGNGREVKLTREGDRAVGWTARFLAKDGEPFEEAHGVLELASTPPHCDHIELAIATLVELDGEDDTEALVARFARDYGREMEIVAQPERCERIRALCVADPALAGRWVVSDDLLAFGGPGPPGYLRTVACGEVDEAIRACRDAEVQRAQAGNREAEREAQCRGLAFAARKHGALELRVVGADGAAWAEQTVRHQKLAVPVWVAAVTPVTVVADVPLMLILPPVEFVHTLWWWYGQE